VVLQSVLSVIARMGEPGSATPVDVVPSSDAVTPLINCEARGYTRAIAGRPATSWTEFRLSCTAWMTSIRSWPQNRSGRAIDAFLRFFRIPVVAPLNSAQY